MNYEFHYLPDGTCDFGVHMIGRTLMVSIMGDCGRLSVTKQMPRDDAIEFVAMIQRVLKATEVEPVVAGSGANKENASV